MVGGGVGVGVGVAVVVVVLSPAGVGVGNGERLLKLPSIKIRVIEMVISRTVVVPVEMVLLPVISD
jgi:hypothetical protein